MKHFITIVAALLALTACQDKTKGDSKILTAETADSTAILEQKEKEAAAADFQHIMDLYNAGNYGECISAISQFRKQHRMALEERKRCISLYEEANLHFAESEVARMSSELKQTEAQIAATKDQTSGNLLRNKRDTLQARIEANREIIKITTEKLANIEQLKNIEIQ